MARYPSRGFGDPPLAVTAAWHRVMWEVLAMRISALWGGIIAILLPATAFFVAALPDPSFAQQESPFFLQGHGGVRVLRGTSEGVNFEAATIAPEDEEVSEGEQQAAVQPTAPVVTPQRGIVTHRAGGNSKVRDRLGGRTPKVSGNKMRTHRMGSSDKKNIPVIRAGRRTPTVNR
jgi:hypothetical protein